MAIEFYINSNDKQLSHLKTSVKEIMPQQKKVTRELLVSLQKRMRRKVELNSAASTGATGALGQSIYVTKQGGGGSPKRFSQELVVGAPYAKFVEYGNWSGAGWINVNTKPELKRWAERVGIMMHGPTSEGKLWLHVGGNNTRQQKGGSKNEFFEISIREELLEDKFMSKTRKAFLDSFTKLQLK